MEDLGQARRGYARIVEAGPGSREELEARHGQVWDTDQMRADFEAVGFAAPFLVVRRKCDGTRGCLTFRDSPRYYFDFTPA